MSDSTTSPDADTRPAGRPRPAPPGIDPRGPRFGAGVTAVLLVITLLLGTGPAATALLSFVGLLFLLGVTRGVQGTLQGLAFKAWVRRRLPPPAELEDPRPPRFAQLVGLLVVGVGLLFAALGFPAAVPVAAAVAVVAAFLNSAFGLCLGCELYLIGRRLAHQN
jgi:cytochrome c biogenesis protein CcdA